MGDSGRREKTAVAPGVGGRAACESSRPARLLGTSAAYTKASSVSKFTQAGTSVPGDSAGDPRVAVASETTPCSARSARTLAPC